jgi:hypothetical protein
VYSELVYREFTLCYYTEQYLFSLSNGDILLKQNTMMIIQAVIEAEFILFDKHQGVYNKKEEYNYGKNIGCGR